MNHPKNDITSSADIQLLVHAFYRKLRSQPYLDTLFEQLTPQEWNQHLLMMQHFWNSVLLKSATYIGHPLILHAFLPARQTQAPEWVHLFYEVLEEHFTGPTAANAKAFAEKMMRIFAYKPAVEQT